MSNKTVVIISGGMDSVTLLYYMKNLLKYETYALTFDYGQRHRKEIESAVYNCNMLGIEHKVVDVSGVSQLLQGSALTSDIAVPEGHYAEESMKLTIVPNRNMIMLSMAIGYAVSIEADSVAYAAHSGDHAIYPDCRPEFVDAMNTVASVANYHQVKVQTPFIGMSKGDIAVIGKNLGVPFEHTWTCYKGEDKPCKKCGACVERIEAMVYAGVNDVQYA